MMLRINFLIDRDVIVGRARGGGTQQRGRAERQPEGSAACEDLASDASCSSGTGP